MNILKSFLSYLGRASKSLKDYISLNTPTHKIINLTEEQKRIRRLKSMFPDNKFLRKFKNKKK